ncbi:MAG: hypothetical protein ACRD1V_13305 [Vicinamibacterales bacterium]
MSSDMSFGRRTAIVAVIAGTTAIGVGAQAPVGWKTVKDRSGRCQASVPGAWTIGDGVLTGSALAANYHKAVVLAGVQQDPTKPMSAERLHQLGAVTVIENTPARTFFTAAPTTASGKVPSQITYTAQVAGTPACTVQVTVPSGQDDALAKQIAGTVGPVK